MDNKAGFTQEKIRGVDERRFYGAFRGIVRDNKDPKKKGRIRVVCPSILGDQLLPWAFYVAPGFHQDRSSNFIEGKRGHGFFHIPEIESAILVEFLEGDPNKPFYRGGWITDPYEVEIDSKTGTENVQPTLTPDEAYNSNSIDAPIVPDYPTEKIWKAERNSQVATRRAKMAVQQSDVNQPSPFIDVGVPGNDLETNKPARQNIHEYALQHKTETTRDIIESGGRNIFSYALSSVDNTTPGGKLSGRHINHCALVFEAASGLGTAPNAITAEKLTFGEASPSGHPLGSVQYNNAGVKSALGSLGGPTLVLGKGDVYIGQDVQTNNLATSIILAQSNNAIVLQNYSLSSGPIAFYQRSGLAPSQSPTQGAIEEGRGPLTLAAPAGTLLNTGPVIGAGWQPVSIGTNVRPFLRVVDERGAASYNRHEHPFTVSTDVDIELPDPPINQNTVVIYPGPILDTPPTDANDPPLYGSTGYQGPGDTLAGNNPIYGTYPEGILTWMENFGGKDVTTLGSGVTSTGVIDQVSIALNEILTFLNSSFPGCFTWNSTDASTSNYTVTNLQQDWFDNQFIDVAVPDFSEGAFFQDGQSGYQATIANEFPFEASTAPITINFSGETGPPSEPERWVPECVPKFGGTTDGYADSPIINGAGTPPFPGAGEENRAVMSEWVRVS